MGRRANPKKGKPARKSAKNDGSQVRDLEKRLAEALQREAAAAKREAEALEQQAATSKILELISSSPTDIQPVLEALAESAARLCGSVDASIYRRDGDRLFLVAQVGPIPQGVIGEFFLPLGRGTVVGRSVLDGRTVHVLDLQAMGDEFPEGREHARRLGLATVLAVPLMRAGVGIGSISLRRTEAQLFTPRQAALLKTFADQAVIAIENVRLFKELQEKNRALTEAHAQVTEALDQQTATSEILRVISSSPTDVQPVFSAIVQSASRLCEAEFSAVVRFEDGLLHLAGTSDVSSAEIEAYQSLFPRPPRRDFIMGRAFLDGSPVHVEDVLLDPDYDPHRLEMLQRAATFRTYLGIPIVRNGIPIGAIGCGRHEMRPFTGAQIELVKTFADQAVIAIENVRLFTELQEKNRALTEAHAQVTEALDQQTATAEILRVISTSPTNLQPVLDEVVKSAARFCGAPDASIFRLDGGNLRAEAHHGPVSLPRGFLVPLIRGSVAGRSVLERQAVGVTDLQGETDEYPEGSALASQTGQRATLSVPLLREGAPIGVILLRRAEAVPFTDKQIALLKTFADQAVIAIENVRLFKELQQKNEALTQAHAQVSETLERQTAMSEILRTISSSPTDLAPTFDAILRSSTRLTGATHCAVIGFDGEMLTLLATNAPPEADEAMHRIFPYRPNRTGVAGRVVLDRAIVHIPDVLQDPDYGFQNTASMAEYRAILGVPMFRKSEVIGALHATRAEPGPFSDAQIELFRTFADQAVIAIENVRLFKELEARNRDLSEALEQQTATSEILRVISRSPTDVQPVIEAIAKSAAQLCDAYDASVWLTDNETLVIRSHYGPIPAPPQRLPIGRTWVTGRAVADGRPIHVDNLATAGDEFPEGQAMALRDGHRTTLASPLLREGKAIGAILIRRAEVRPFSDKHIELLKTFADQAVIAIENVRLFKELEARNHDLTEALEQKTATAEILRVISGSPTDVAPIFDTIAESAWRLCAATRAAVYRFDGALVHFVAHHGYPDEALAIVQTRSPSPPDRSLAVTRAILDQTVVHIPDVFEDTEHRQPDLARAAGVRSLLSVPMLRDGKALGAIVVGRGEPGPFSEGQIALLQTFADQAVIAVENVRLFKELQARTGELTQSVEQLTALGEVSRAVTSTLDVEAVLETVVSRARQLAGADGCLIYEYDEGSQQFHSRAADNLDREYAEALRGVPIRKGEGVSGRAAEMREAVQVADMTQPSAYESSVRDITIRAGYRAVLSVPLLREDEIIGSLILIRKTPGEFSPEIVELLKTFATQSALAIQNARLFREIADKSAQLEAASQHKSEFLANMSHELRTPLNAIIGFSEVLNERMFGELNDKQAEYLKDIYASGQHLLSLINDILDLSKIEAGRMELEAADFDLPSAIDNALILVRERATRRGITLGRTVDDRLGIVRGDERKVKQVLLNLLSNALKFTPEGGRIDVSAHLQDGAAEIAVADTGVGIAPEDQEAIFEEFRQVGTADKKVEGTGLGLPLSRKFIELHGGRIWVSSELGKGSTFTFRLPMRHGE